MSEESGRSVMHVVTSLHYGGLERRILALFGAKSAHRYRHSVVAIRDGGHVAGELSRLGVEPTLLEAKGRTPNASAIIKLARKIRDTRPDVVHCHGAEANFHGLIAAWVMSVPLRIGEEIGLPDHSPIAKFAFRHVYATSHGVVAMSPSVRAALTVNREIEPTRIVEIFNAVAVPETPPNRNAPTDRVRMIFLGRLEPVKNPSAVLDAVRVLIEEGYDVELLFVGDGSLRWKLERSVDEWDLRDSVQFLGFVEDPFPILADCHMLIQPSLSEGFSLALIEALACELPAVVSRVGGAGDLIVEKETGWFVDPSKRESILSALRQAVSLGPSRLEAMGKTARASVMGRFSPREYASRLEAFYDQKLLEVRGTAIETVPR